MNSAIYLDYAATTPLDPRVLDAMLPYFADRFGNPSSIHRWGQQAEAALESARRIVAEILGCQPDEIIFTSGGSEADNLALRGAALAERERRGANHMVTTPIEHAAVLGTLRHLRDHYGFELTVLPVDAAGRVNPTAVAASLRSTTALVSVMYASNEIGTVQPIAEIAGVCRERGVRLHTDAVQAASQLDVDVQQLGVDYLALGAHKFYGPKGVGALYARAGCPLLPMQTGGAHEQGRRAGTPNVPYIVGLAEALKLTAAERAAHNARFAGQRDRLIDGVLTTIPDSVLTGHRSERLPNHASFAFRGVDGNELLMHLDLAGIAASSGSACKTGDPEPSEVLLALGLSPEWALGSLRLTVGRATADSHVDHVLAALPSLVDRLRLAEAAA
jgi:cysteine desulfurase